MKLARNIKKRIRTASWRHCERLISRDPTGGTNDATPVFVLSEPRTGSELLLSYFNSVPGIRSSFEILNPRFFDPHIQRRELDPVSGRPIRVGLFDLAGSVCLRFLVGNLALRFSSKDSALRYIAAVIAKFGERFGVAKFQANHLKEAGLSAQDLVEHFPNARFVVLYRRTLAQQYVSLQIALQTNKWTWRQNNKHYHPFTDQLTVDRDDLNDFFRQSRRTYDEWLGTDGLLSRGTVVCYEDLCAKPQAIFDESIFPLLGIERSSVVNKTLRKMNTRGLDEVIGNHAEIKDLLESPAAKLDYSLVA